MHVLSRRFLPLLLLTVLVLLTASPLGATCQPISLGFTIGTPNAEGDAAATITYQFDQVRIPNYIYLYRDNVHVSEYYVYDLSGTIETTLALGCSFPPPFVMEVRAGAGECEVRSSQTVSIDSTASGGVSASAPDINGDSVISLAYDFPYTRAGTYTRAATLWLEDSAGHKFHEKTLLGLGSSGTATEAISTACMPEGTYAVKANLFSCGKTVLLSSSLTVQSHPAVSVAVTDTGGTMRRADIDYLFPHSPNGRNVGRSVRFRLYDSAETLRSEQIVNPLDREGAWAVNFDTACWPPGEGRVEADAWCTTDVGHDQAAVPVTESADVSVELDQRDQAVATVRWTFTGAPGRVRTVMQRLPAQAEVVLGDFMATTVTGSIDYVLPLPEETLEVIVRATATTPAGCRYDFDAAGATCGCGRLVLDPVDLADGNMHYADTDPLPMHGGASLARGYDSRHAAVGRFGAGWKSFLDSRITLNRPAAVSVVTAEGEPFVFQEQGASGGLFEQQWPRAAARATLTYDAVAHTFTFRPAGSSTEWIYSESTTRLTAIRDLATGRSTIIGSDASGNPLTIADSWGAWSWTVATDPSSGVVTSLQLDGETGWLWSYEYDPSGHLARAAALGSLTWRTYEYSSGRMTAARDAVGNLIESHQYDANGRAVTSVGPSGDASAIEYGLPGSTPGETITRVTSTAGAVSEYRLQLAGGTVRRTAADGGCASCGSGDSTTVYDGHGLVIREQDAAGYITATSYDPATHARLSVQSSLRPAACDPATDTNRCRMPSGALATVTLVATSATLSTGYTYGDALWPDRPTIVRTTSVVSGTRDEAMTYDAATGQLLVHSVTGWTGSPAVRQTRTTTTTLYDGIDGAVFDPGGTFSSAWLALPQPRAARKSVDGPLPGADVTSFVYYPNEGSVPSRWRGRLAAVRNAAGHVTRFEDYDVFGSARRTIDPNGVVTETTYDALGRLVTSTLKGVPGCDTDADALCATDLVSTRTYPGAGPMATDVRPDGAATAYGYDGRGRVTTVSRGPSAANLLERIATEYDPASGRKSIERVQAFEGTAWVTKKSDAYTYDSKARLTSVVHADTTAVHYTYDARDQVSTVRDENHGTPNTFYLYDAAGRLSRVEQTLATAAGGKIATSYTYDVAGNLASVTDPNGNVTTYTYDDFGAMLSQTSPVTGTTTYSYDEGGDLVSTTDATGATTTRTYDLLHRMLSAVSSRTGSETEEVTYTYDGMEGESNGIGRVGSMATLDTWILYRYERRGLLVSALNVTSIENGVFGTTFGYDAAGNRTRIGYPSGRVVDYTFDYASRPLSAFDGGTALVTSATYLPFGPMRTMTYGNGTAKSMTYDGRYQLTENSLTAASGVLADYVYQHDPAGNITRIHDAVNSAYDRDFGYDDLNRLTAANTGAALWGSGSYTYDEMGNMTSLNLGTRSLSFSYVGATPKIQSVTGTTPATPTYDAAGNEQTLGSISARNLVQGRNIGNVNGVNYLYDGRGVRMITVRGNASRPWTISNQVFLYSPELQLLATSVPSSTFPAEGFAGTEYLWFGGQPIAQISTFEPTDVRYTFTDHLGTPILQTNTGANVTWRAEYEPYGRVYTYRAGTATDPQILRFPGQELAGEQAILGVDDATYNIFRWYKSGWGRYTQADPVGIGGKGIDLPGRGWQVFSQRRIERARQSGFSGATAQTLYAYVDDNPSRASDPLGLWIRWDCLATRTTPYSTSRPRDPQNIRNGTDYVCAYEVKCEAYEPYLSLIVTIDGFWIRYMNTQRPCKCEANCSFSVFGVPQTVMGRNLFVPSSSVICSDSPLLPTAGRDST